MDYDFIVRSLESIIEAEETCKDRINGILGNVVRHINENRPKTTFLESALIVKSIMP